jgi:hypothetical protein
MLSFNTNEIFIILPPSNYYFIQEKKINLFGINKCQHQDLNPAACKCFAKKHRQKQWNSLDSLDVTQ